MEVLARVCVSWCIFVLLWDESNSIGLSTQSLMEVNTTDPAPGNGSAHFVLVPRRPAVLIINDPTAPTNMSRWSRPHLALRASTISRKSVKCLKYVEYDEKNPGVILNTVVMYDLKDVADFFYMYLETKICNQVCPEEQKEPE